MGSNEMLRVREVKTSGMTPYFWLGWKEVSITEILKSKDIWGKAE